MSDEEYSEEEVEEVEEEVEEEPEEIKVQPPKPATTTADDINDESLTEAEKAMLAAKRRQEEEDAAKIQDYEARRKAEREKEEEELKKLKEKQEQRRLEREKEQEMNARREAAEQARREEEEQRKARMEEDRRKKEEEKKKRQQSLAQPFAPTGAPGGRNFVIPEKKDRGDKFGNIVQAKQEMGMTKEQQDEQKHAYIEHVMRQIDLDNFSGGELKNKIKELHQRICKLEADKYDLEKRHERQEYDLKELNERQRQVTRNKALKKGLDPADTGNSRYPPKVSVFSKYDRQIDRRNFKERRSMYEKPNAYPCFPNVAPPPIVLEFKLQNAGSHMGDEEQHGREMDVEEDEGEYEDEE